MTRGLTERPLRRWTPLLAVAALLALAWAASALSAPQITNLPIPRLFEASEPPATPPPSVSAEPTGTPSAEAEQDRVEDVPDWATTFAAMLCLVVAVGAGGVVSWLLVRDKVTGRSRRRAVPRPDAPRHAARTEAVVAAVDAGLTQLSDADADPRRAVIACWVRLEQTAAAAGTPRHVGDSPTDLVTRLLHAHRVTRPALDDLVAVYHEARYATHTIDERMRLAALAALRQLRAELSPPRRPGVSAHSGAGEGWES